MNKADCSPNLYKPFVVGNHIYQYCWGCGRYIKQTGFSKGIHLCAP